MEIGKIWMTRKALILSLAGIALVLSVVSFFFILATQPKHITLSLDGVAKTYETHAETVEEFLNEQNITVLEHDLLTPQATTPLSESMTIQLQTSWAVPVLVDGQTKVVHTVKRDVAGVLKEAGITLRQQDKVQPALASTISKDTKITISRLDEKIVQVQQEVPFQEIRKADATLTKGQTRVLRKGKPGKAVLHYKVYLENGKEVSRKLVKRDVVASKQDQVLLVGTGQKTVRAASITSRGGLVFRPRQVLSNVSLTAYSPSVGTRTATGMRATEGRTIAVDPSVIPLGWWVYIDGIGYRRAEDTGGAVKGNKIDIFFGSEAEANRFGRKRAKTVYIIGPKKP